MAQSFPTILSTDTLKASRDPLLQRDAAAASNFEGTAFPSSGLMIGMLCHRTDLGKIYSLKDLTPTWVEVFDLTNGSPRAVQLNTSRNFSLTGDVTATAIAFNGTSAVALNAVLASSGVTAGTYCKVTVDAKGRVTVGAALSSSDVPQDLSISTIRLTSSGNVSLASTTHPFQIGADAATNIAIDANEIQGRNAGAASALFLNNNGGNVTLGDGASSAITLNGTLSSASLMIATAAEAQAGSVNTKIMTPAKVDSYVTNRLATAAEAQAGTDSSVLMTPLRTAQAIAVQAIGVGQTWQSVTGSRTPGTSYQNATGRPIHVCLHWSTASASSAQVSENGSTWVTVEVNNTSGAASSASFTVPAGHYYRTNNSVAIFNWSELR